MLLDAKPVEEFHLFAHREDVHNHLVAGAIRAAEKHEQQRQRDAHLLAVGEDDVVVVALLVAGQASSRFGRRGALANGRTSRCGRG